MQSNYSQIRAMLAITKASLRAIFRSPSAVLFSIAFPLIFILVFGFIGSSGKISVSVAFTSQSDTANPVFAAIRKMSGIKIAQKENQPLYLNESKSHIIELDSNLGDSFNVF